MDIGSLWNNIWNICGDSDMCFFRASKPIFWRKRAHLFCVAWGAALPSLPSLPLDMYGYLVGPLDGPIPHRPGP